MRRSPEGKKRELIDNLVATRRLILDALQGLDPAQAEQIFLGEWSVSDLLAHLVGWDYTNLQAVQEILAGKTPGFFRFSDKDWRSYNRQLVEKYKRQPFTALLVDVEESQRQLIGFLETVPARDLIQGKAPSPSGRTVSIQSLLRAETRDENQHAGQVQAFWVHP